MLRYRPIAGFASCLLTVLALFAPPASAQTQVAPDAPKKSGQATLYRFDFSGTIRYVGGSITDGSLLPDFTSADADQPFSGWFIFREPAERIERGTTNISFTDCIEEFHFGTASSVGEQEVNTQLILDATVGQVYAYGQYYAGSGIYDAFEFSIFAGAGSSPFSDVSFNLTKLDPADFPPELATLTLVRADFSSNPAPFTEVVANLGTFRVTRIH